MFTHGTDKEAQERAGKEYSASKEAGISSVRLVRLAALSRTHLPT